MKHFHEAATRPIAFGRIEEIKKDHISGWLYSPTRTVVPVVSVDGRFLEPRELSISRQDVAKQLGGGVQSGWEVSCDRISKGSEVALYAYVNGALHKVASEISEVATPGRIAWADFERVRQVATQPEAVAITCWDVSHNPLGRAKVLYDSISSRRPAALIGYINRDFGSTPWMPLIGANLPLLTIPWDEREVYHDLLRNEGISFPTVWLCKPRLPTFELAHAVSNPNSKLILDMDDNEEFFSSSVASAKKVYGGAGLSLARQFAGRIASRTVASTTLQEDFGGEVLRHIRQPYITAEQVSYGSEKTIENNSLQQKRVRVGFLGTVRSHKNIVAAARAIAAGRWERQLDVEFHVFGDISPELLISQLEDCGAKVHGEVLSEDTLAVVNSFDVVLTGFPSSSFEHEKANYYQITSKIGDALACGKPVLVPWSPAVADLKGIPGVFLFSESTFYDALIDAIEWDKPISLPHEFTSDAGYNAFVTAEKLANDSPRALDVLREYDFGLVRAASLPLKKPTILLIWKQNDAGLYGRRIDQIARACMRMIPGVEVRVLEFMHNADEKRFADTRDDCFTDSRLIQKFGEIKARGWIDEDGVIYDQISVKAWAETPAVLSEFLAAQGLIPNRTIVGYFPEIRPYQQIREVLRPYKSFVDVVDNHFAWNSSNPNRSAQVAAQYREMILNAEHVMFGSKRNYEYFISHGLLTPEVSSSIVPNWYATPAGYRTKTSVRSSEPSEFNIFYSGNMNDRVDWDILRSLSRLDSRIRLHLVGSARNEHEALRQTLESDRVTYYGPRDESYVCDLLSGMDAAVIPHTKNAISEFMNPLKLYMFSKMGVPTIAVDVPGLDHDVPGLTVVSDGFGMLSVIREMVGGNRFTKPHTSFDSGVNFDHPRRYTDLIKNIIASLPVESP